MRFANATPITVLHVKAAYRSGGLETLTQRIMEILDETRIRQRLVLLDTSARNQSPQNRDVCRIAWRGIPLSPLTAAGLKKVIHEQRADLIHTHDMRSNLVAFLLTRVWPIPWIASVHGWLGHTHSGRWRWYEALEGQLIRAADRVMVGSTASRDEVAHCGSKRVRVIHHGIPIPEVTTRSEPALRVRADLGAGPGTVIIGVVSRVHPGKGLRALILAVEALIEKKLDVMGVIVGEGADRESLQEYVVSRGLEKRIRLTGFMEDQDPWLAAMDVVALPTLKDSFPFSILDGMALGKPVVTTSVGDLPFAVEDGRNGYLIPPGELPPLVAALERLVLDPELRREMGERGREDVRQRFSTEAMSEKLEEMYREVLANDPATVAGGDPSRNQR